MSGTETRPADADADVGEDDGYVLRHPPIARPIQMRRSWCIYL
jgi:hypothetical protein